MMCDSQCIYLADVNIHYSRPMCLMNITASIRKGTNNEESHLLETTTYSKTIIDNTIYSSIKCSLWTGLFNCSAKYKRYVLQHYTYSVLRHRIINMIANSKKQLHDLHAIMSPKKSVHSYRRIEKVKSTWISPLAFAPVSRRHYFTTV